MKKLLAAVTIALALGAALPASAAGEHIITIGTGSVTGVYYPAGGAICRLINRGRKEHNIRCFVESTGGSIYNLHALKDGEISFGIVQSDWQYNAYKGLGLFAEGPAFSDLRSVFSLHSESFTVAVARNSGIENFNDLKGKRVNIGDTESGMREIMQHLMAAKGWTKASFAEADELKPTEAARALCDGRVDAMVFAAGHPNGLIQDITSNCGAKLIGVEGHEVDKLIADNPFYSKTAIPGGMYQGNPQSVPTFGVKATLVTTAAMDDETVYQLVKAVFENFDSFKTLHFVFATLDRERMVSTGLIAPIHPGAMRYYREIGLIKDESKLHPNMPDIPASAGHAKSSLPLKKSPLRAPVGQQEDPDTGE